MTTKAQLMKQIGEKFSSEMQEESVGIERHEAIHRALKDQVGKKITERMTKKIQAELPSHTVYLNKIGSLIQIVIWQKSSNTDRTSHLLAYDSDPTFRVGSSTEQHSGFEYYDNSHGQAAIKRNYHRINFLNSNSFYMMADKMLEKAKLDKEIDFMMEMTDCPYALKEIQKTL